MSKTIQVKCEGCGKEAKDTAKNLFNEGWDVPPYFTQVITCPNCPSAPILIAKIEQGEKEDEESIDS